MPLSATILVLLMATKPKGALVQTLYDVRGPIDRMGGSHHMYYRGLGARHKFWGAFTPLPIATRYWLAFLTSIAATRIARCIKRLYSVSQSKIMTYIFAPSSCISCINCVEEFLLCNLLKCAICCNCSAEGGVDVISSLCLSVDRIVQNILIRFSWNFVGL